MKLTTARLKSLIKEELNEMNAEPSLKERRQALVDELEIIDAEILAQSQEPLSDLDAMKAQHDAENAHADVMAPGGPFERSFRR
tara:strand:- start:229 stop:480 length:252 start_codon:yes stop_codon:yes gene_type:complete